MIKDSILQILVLLITSSSLASANQSKTPKALQASPKERIEANINMSCVTEFPSTSFFVRQYDKEVKVRVIHHNGVKFAPIWSGLITPHDISTITEAADSVAKLGDEFEITWKRDACNADSEMFFQCVGQAQDFTTATGEKVHPWAISVYDVTENSIYGEFKKKSISLRFNVDEKSNQITMDYYPKDCFIDSSKVSTPNKH